MSYLPFIKVLSNKENDLDYAEAAKKIVESTLLNKKFKVLMGVDGENDGVRDPMIVEKFLKDFYDCRNDYDKKNNINILSYDEKNSPYLKLHRNYYNGKKRILDNIITEFFLIRNVSITINETRYGVSLKFEYQNFLPVTVHIGNGSSKQNQGSKYEDDFIYDWNHREDENPKTNAIEIISKILKDKNIPEDLVDKVEKTGTKNTRRFGKDFFEKICRVAENKSGYNRIFWDDSYLNCGKKIADATIFCHDGENIYLSLKKSNINRLANIGIKKYAKLKNDNLTSETVNFYKAFMFDAKTFKDMIDYVYHQDGPQPLNDIDLKTKRDWKETLYNNYEEFRNFIVDILQYSLGYGYWYVEADQNHSIEITKNISDEFKEYLEKNIQDIFICYPTKTRKSGIIKVRINDENIKDIYMYFKNSEGGEIYPDRISVEWYSLYEVLESLERVNEEMNIDSDYDFNDDVLFDNEYLSDDSEDEFALWM